MMRIPQAGIFYLNPTDWTWWAWLVTAISLAIGMLGIPRAFLIAMALTLAQGVVFFVKDRSLSTFSVQLRVAYLSLLALCYLPAMRWLYCLPTIGTFALVIFGYCLMARFLSLLPWNSSEPYSVDRIRRTFFSAPSLLRMQGSSSPATCSGGLCTIEAQVAPASQKTEQDGAGAGNTHGT
jgi:hypothetical protein